jgi:hypothetical protein
MLRIFGALPLLAAVIAGGFYYYDLEQNVTKFA